LPGALLTPIQRWHHSLGVPKARIEETMKNGKPTGRYHAIIDPLPCRTLTLAPEVLDAYYTYNDVLLEMIINGDVAQDLDSCYGRFHMKALRIAILLASFDGQSRIELKHWAYAQAVAEEWRLMLHQLVHTSEGAVALTREEMLEERIERALAQHGGMTGRQLNMYIRGYASREITNALDALTKAERITAVVQGKTRLYTLPGDPTHTREGTKEEEIPF
jgi:DNA-binding transcriptional ArsR family regulator